MCHQIDANHVKNSLILIQITSAVLLRKLHNVIFCEEILLLYFSLIPRNVNCSQKYRNILFVYLNGWILILTLITDMSDSCVFFKFYCIILTNLRGTLGRPLWIPSHWKHITTYYRQSNWTASFLLAWQAHKNGGILSRKGWDHLK